MFSNYSSYSAPMLMAVELGSNELEVDFYEDDCKYVGYRISERQTNQSKLVYLTEKYV